MPRKEDRRCIWVVDGGSFRGPDQSESAQVFFDVWVVCGDFTDAVYCVVFKVGSTTFVVLGRH